MVSVQDGFYFLFVSSEPEHLVCSWECLCFFFGFFFFKFFNFLWFNDWNVFLQWFLWSNFLLVLAHHSFLNDWRRWYLFLFNFFHFVSFISFFMFMFIFFLFFFFCVISLSFFFWWNKKEVIFVGLAFLLFFGDDFLTQILKHFFVSCKQAKFSESL